MQLLGLLAILPVSHGNASTAEKARFVAGSDLSSKVSWDISGHRLKKYVDSRQMEIFATTLMNALHGKRSHPTGTAFYFDIGPATKEGPDVAWRLGGGALQRDSATTVNDFVPGWGMIISERFPPAAPFTTVSIGVAKGP